LKRNDFGSALTGQLPPGLARLDFALRFLFVDFARRQTYARNDQFSTRRILFFDRSENNPL
jgi:hypothetical protein